MLSSLQFTHGGSMAPRSERVMLSRPSSLPGHSDSPNAHDRPLPVSSGLQAADRRRSVIPRVPCCSRPQTVAGNHHRLRLGEMSVPALPADLTGYIFFLMRNDPAETPGSQVLHSSLFPRMPSALLRVPDRCVSPLLPCQHRPSPQA